MYKHKEWRPPNKREKKLKPGQRMGIISTKPNNLYINDSRQ